MNEPAVTFVVTSYLPNSLLPTLQSIDEAMKAWSFEPYVVALSDSSPSDYAVVEATQWSQSVRSTLVVDHSPARRIQKEALNAAFAMQEVSRADIVIVTNDDVILEPNSVGNLIRALQNSPSAVFAVGSTLPDPSYAGGKRRAGAWQLYAVNRLAQLLPATCVRSEGALWATRGTFAKSSRWPINGGSISDDVEIARYVVQNDLTGLNVANAIAYKIPPEGFKDFNTQTQRSDDSKVSELSSQVSTALKFKALVATFGSHPISALIYVTYRFRTIIMSWRRDSQTNETWSRQASTLR